LPTYLLRAADSDLSGGADWNKQLLYGTEGAATLSASILKTATETQYGYSNASIPYNAAWPTGNWTVRVYVTTGSSYIYGSVSISRVNSAGTVQQTCTVSAEQQMTNAGSYTFSFTSLAWTAGAVGDRIRINYLFRNSKTNGAISIVIRTGTDTDVVSPVPYTPASTLSTSSPGSPALSKSGAYARTLSVTAGGTPLLARAANYLRALSVAAGNYPSVSAQNTKQRTLSTTSAGVPLLEKMQGYFRTLAVTGPGAPSLSRYAAVLRTLSASSPGMPAFSWQLSYVRALAVACPGVPSLSRLACFFRALAAAAGTTLKLDLEIHSGGGPIEIEINGTCGSSPSMGTENPIIAKLKRVYCSIMSLFV